MSPYASSNSPTAIVKGREIQPPIGQRKRFRSAKTIRRAIRRAASGSLLTIGLLASIPQFSHADAVLKISDDASITVGFGLRVSYTSTENGAPDGDSNSNSFAPEALRLYTSGQLGKVFKSTFTAGSTGGAAATGGDDLRVLDAIAQFEPSDLFNVWVGRMFPPNDRANLYGPFYSNAWAYPSVASRYPNLVIGRDNGMTIWGKPTLGMIAYAVGVFNGHDRSATLSNASNNSLFAGRVVVNFWDPEPAPAYFQGSTYYGRKNILAVGVAGNYQKNGVGTLADPGDLRIWSVDTLLEKKLADGGVPTIEGAYYRYETGGKVDCGSGEPGATVCPPGDNIGGQVQGKAYMLSVSYLFASKVYEGQFQPIIRYQRFERDVSQTTKKATDVGFNYIVNGPNAKASVTYTMFDDTRLAPADTASKQIIVGFQFQY